MKRKLNGKVQSKEKMKSSEFIWDGDALVYSCKEPKYGVMGGVDKVLDMYTCQGSSGKYNVPNGLNMKMKTSGSLGLSVSLRDIVSRQITYLLFLTKIRSQSSLIFWS